MRETTNEKKKYVFWILKNIVPFLTGQAQMKVEVETTNEEIPSKIRNTHQTKKKLCFYFIKSGLNYFFCMLRLKN